LPDTIVEALAPASNPSDLIAPPLLAWYDRARRVLPWRALPGVTPDPYRVWLSEVMLQQTTVEAVKPYFERFLGEFPTLQALAAAPLERVLELWAGLGYYARARNLHACAKAVAERHDGRLPADEALLRALPGIGDYTAAAVLSIAFDRPAAPMDGNWERVVARLFAVETPLPAAKPELKRLAAGLVPERRAGDFAQAMMDLGATICTPAKPRCLLCPLSSLCGAYRLGIAETLPARAPKAERPVRHGWIYYAARPDRAVLLRRRPPKGLLGGMMELPGTPWRAEPWTESEALAHAPVGAEWRRLKGQVGHTFTHFHLELVVLAGRSEAPAPEGHRWAPAERLGDEALPSLMRKVLRKGAASQ
jgi:A/G-specific adenine glycosylase